MGMTKNEKNKIREIVRRLREPVEVPADREMKNYGICTYPFYKTIDKWSEEEDIAIYKCIQSGDDELYSEAIEAICLCMNTQQIDKKSRTITFMPVNLKKNQAFKDFVKCKGNSVEQEAVIEVYEVMVAKIKDYDPSKGKTHSSVYSFINYCCIPDVLRNLHVSENVIGQTTKLNKEKISYLGARRFLLAKGIENPTYGDLREAAILLAKPGHVRYRYDWTLSRLMKASERNVQTLNGDFVTLGDEDEFENLKDESSILYPTGVNIERQQSSQYWIDADDIRMRELEDLEKLAYERINVEALKMLSPVHERVVRSYIRANVIRANEPKKKSGKAKKKGDEGDIQELEKRQEIDINTLKSIYINEFGGSKNISTDSFKRLLSVAIMEYQKERIEMVLSRTKVKRSNYTVGIKYSDNTEENDTIKDDIVSMFMNGDWEN